jgi:hypothetical protein
MGSNRYEDSRENLERYLGNWRTTHGESWRLAGGRLPGNLIRRLTCLLRQNLPKSHKSFIAVIH